MGDALARYNLAYLYRRGLGVRQNDRTAFDPNRLAADQGLADAQYQLAIFHTKAIGTSRDLLQAARRAHPTAAKGNALAIINLPGYVYAVALAFLRGNAQTKQHRAKVYKWFTMAAALSDAKAEAHIATLQKNLSLYRSKKARSAAATCLPSGFTKCW